MRGFYADCTRGALDEFILIRPDVAVPAIWKVFMVKKASKAASESYSQLVRSRLPPVIGFRLEKMPISTDELLSVEGWIAAELIEISRSGDLNVLVDSRDIACAEFKGGARR